MEPPRLYLAIDNCFASKRWTRPREWMRVVRDLGVRYVEASADTECDPLYTVPEYLDDWTEEVARSEAETGCKVANLYTGHGTYSTLGLCHFDPRVSDHILRRWLVPMSAVAARLHAGLGFFCHAFSAAALRDRASHDQQMGRLLDRLVELSLAAATHGLSTLSIEQMYSPNQPPWTIAGSRALMGEVWRRSRSPLYLTIDTGHQTGQKRYLRPDQAATQEILRRVRAGEAIRGEWQGHGVGLAALEGAAQESGSTGVDAIARMERAIAEHAYLFAGTEDTDPYTWLTTLACYSPIIHLQQTSGGSSSHAAFTPAHNRTGIIAAERVLQAIAASYAGAADRDMPPPCAHIYLTLELFYGPADYDEDVLAGVGQSVDYWRRFIPVDGLTLDQLAGGGR